MNRNIYFIFAAVLFLLPLQSFAFVPYNPYARVLEDNAAVFSISYGFKANKEALYLPVLGSTNPSKNQFGFRVRANDEPGEYVNAFGFVLSSTTIKDGMYVIEPGQSATFTAVMVVQSPKDDLKMDYKTHLNYLPFYQGADKRFLPLNKYQLESYITKVVSI